MEGLEGKEVTIFYDDGQHISRKDGTLTKQDSQFHTLDNKTLIPNSRIIRIEVKN